EADVVLLVDDPRAVRGADLLARLVAAAGRRRGELAEQRAGVVALRVAVAEVAEDRVRKPRGHFAEPLVACALEVRQFAIGLAPVVAALLGRIVRAEEEQMVLHDRPAAIQLGPVEVLLEAREARALLDALGHVVSLELVAQLAAVAARAGLADRVD